jgi:hypothetical protein
MNGFAKMGEDESGGSQSIIVVALRLQTKRLAPQPGAGMLISLRHDLIIGSVQGNAHRK